MSLVLRNAIDIHVLTANNLSEPGWNIKHAFESGRTLFWKSEDVFDVCFQHTKGIFRSKKPKTSISASADHSSRGITDCCV